ncbi:T9SS type A sorting domain-containing protein [Hymenobacter ruricola]|uniref:T9SS type A sorting domain-containing protein n=1 Tax=Hymenobacter ruricola TaxID=2791023 RepID=A0ABS0I1Y8_9BACT|nr:T9SS type A sorting domain-containing protein [Hymenobacter ruricola]MBF9220950.1 T9SS type A sorting domain-containing protein [Hymenobacter ruricola]
MKQLFTTRLLKCLAFLLCLWPMLGSAAPFTPGNLVVLRVGDGAASLTSAATPAYLQEYTPAGVLVQTIPLPTATSGNNRSLTVAGSSSTDGGMTRSANGAYLVLAGYDAAPGTAAVAGLDPSTGANRIVGRVAADGTVDTSTRLTDATGNLRSAATVDGSSFYTSGSSGGVRYVPYANAGASVVISGTPSNLRYVNTFGGNLYVSSGSSPYIGLSQVGTGLPTTSGQTTTLLPGMQGTTSTTAGISPLAFYFADLSTTVPGLDVVYVADDGATATGGGIQKWSLVGSTWTLNGTITNATPIRGLDGQTTGTTVSMVAAGNGGLYVLSDNAGYNAAPSTTAVPAPIATAASMTAFRGATFAPVAAAAAPTIASFTPTNGGPGATVTITGTNFTGATAVTLNGVAITGYTVVNATTITFTVPTTATSGTIAVTTPGGTATSTGTFTFNAPATAPTITSFTPTSGPVGTTVTVTGTNFTGATGATLNGTAVTAFTVVSATSATFTVPTGATSGVIAITTPAGTGTSTASFTVTVPAVTPVITQLAPGVQVVGGAAVTFVITGTGFTSTSTVNFNGVSYPQTTSTATSIEALIPASAFTTVGSFPVTVTNSAGTSNAFTFTVNNVSTAGAFENFETGTKTGYASAAVVLTSGSWTFSDALIGNAFNDRANGLKAARIRVGFIRMDFDKPNGAGTVIVNAGLFGTDTGATFVLEKSTDGGATFTAVPGAPATLTNVITPYTFTVNQAGNVRFRITSTATINTQRINIDDISISDFAGASNPVPVITSITPNSAVVNTTVTVTITGTGFTSASTVVAGGQPIPSTFVSATQLTGTVPAGTPVGTYTVAVVNPTPGGGTSNTVTFTIVPPAPTITSFTPTSGGPGTTVTVTGTNLMDATAVRIGAVNVTNYSVVSATTITFVVPNGTGSLSGPITVVTPGGTATSTGSFNIVSAALASQALPGLTVFPNPATDRLTVTLPAAGAATVALRDLAGRLVLAPTALGADKQVLLPAGLAAGVYMLEVRQGDVFAVRRIQKN